MAGGPAEHVYRDSGVGEPGQRGVPEVVAAQMFVAELVTTVSQCVASRRTAVEMRPPRGPVNRRASGLGPADRMRWATMLPAQSRGRRGPCSELPRHDLPQRGGLGDGFTEEGVAGSISGIVRLRVRVTPCARHRAAAAG